MALIKCPKCGTDVSDKAKRCPNCGETLQTQKVVKVCEECGYELDDNATICPKCGCPVPESEEQKKTRKKKKIIISIIAILVVIFAIIAIVCMVNVTNQKKAEEAAAAAEAAKVQEANDYVSNLKLASFTMLTGASTAEEAGTLIHDVWYDTIFDKHNADTSKYTSGNSDFNDSLSELFSDEEFQDKITSIKSNQDTVKDLMQELTNPPAEYEEAYDTLKNYYDAYLELTNLAISPTGSSQSYTDDFNEADSNVLKYYNAMDVYIE